MNESQLADREGWERSARRMWGAAVLLFAGLSVVLTFVLPRPYYVLSGDYDNGHYYNLRARYRGLPIHNVEHPGTPVIVLGSLLMTAATEPLDQTQSFLDELYLVVGGATCASLGVFGFLALRRASPGAAALSLSSLVAWPAFLVGLNQFCTESFVLVGGLIALALFWRVLESFPSPRVISLALVGATCGLCLAIKMSFAPFVLAMSAALGLTLVRSDLRAAKKGAGLLAFGLAGAGGFLVATIPVFHRLDEVLLKTLLRGDVRVPGSLLSSLGESSWALLREGPAFVVLFVTSLVGALVVTVRHLRLPLANRARPGEAEVSFDRVAGIVFIVLLSSAFLYVLACAAPGLGLYGSVGHSLRNASPAALVVPFAILFCFRVGGARGGSEVFRRLERGRAPLAVAALVVLSAVSVHLVERDAWIRSRVGEIAVTKARFEELRQRYGTISYWDGSPGWRLGEASFHYWGDYRYAESYFEDEIRAEFKGTSWLPLREIRKRVREAEQADSVASRPGDLVNPRAQAEQKPLWRRVLHRVHERWLEAKRSHPGFPRDAPAFSDAPGNPAVGLLAFPEAQAVSEVYQPLHWTRADLHSWLEERFGPLRLWTERIGTAEWIFLVPLHPQRAEVGR